MASIVEMIAKDEELSKLLMYAFYWRGRGRNHYNSCDEAMVKLADCIYEKTGIDIMLYT